MDYFIFRRPWILLSLRPHGSCRYLKLKSHVDSLAFLSVQAVRLTSGVPTAPTAVSAATGQNATQSPEPASALMVTRAGAARRPVTPASLAKTACWSASASTAPPVSTRQESASVRLDTLGPCECGALQIPHEFSDGLLCLQWRRKSVVYFCVKGDILTWSIWGLTLLETHLSGQETFTWFTLKQNEKSFTFFFNMCLTSKQRFKWDAFVYCVFLINIFSFYLFIYEDILFMLWTQRLIFVIN